MAYEIRELGVGGILDQAIRIVKDHFGLLLGIVGVAYLPAALLMNYISYAYIPPFPANFSPESMQAYAEASQAAQKYTLPLALLVGYVIIPVTNAAVVWAVAKLYLGERTSIGDAFKRAFRMLIPLTVTFILFFLVLMLGFILLVVPFFIFMFWFCLHNHVVIIEGIWGPKALSRSKALVKGSFGTAVVLGFMILVIQLLVYLGMALFGHNIVQVLVASIVSSVVLLFFAAVGVVFYFSCRCKTENFDLTMLAENVVSSDEP